MRTILTLSDAARDSARLMAVRRGLGLSRLVDQAAMIGLAQFDDPIAIDPDPETGFPTCSTGQVTTRAAVEWARDWE
ncbi:MAG: hypothetical protein LBG60_17505 [Bifidobacteriaceae bacterium]|nr:hypothetical protein [Bifidobacteriaceae bacterium]